jgi:hypothetical protein
MISLKLTMIPVRENSEVVIIYPVIYVSMGDLLLNEEQHMWLDTVKKTKSLLRKIHR